MIKHECLRLAFVACAVMHSLAAGAGAQTVVLVPQKGLEQVPMDDVRRNVHEALAAAIAMQGMSVLAFEDAKRALPPGESCDRTDCAMQLLAFSRAELAVAVAVWSDAQRVPARVHVTLLDRDGHRYPGAAAIEQGDVRGASTAALLDARALQLLGPGPWLSVRGTPDGARIYLDGKLAGKVPYRATIRPGRYELQVRADGYAPFEQALDVPTTEARRVDRVVALEPAVIELASTAASPADDMAHHTRLRTEHPLLGPIVLGALGAGVLATTLLWVATAETGCRKTDSAGVCLERREVDAGWAVAWSTAGAGALVGAALWYVLGAQDVAVDIACTPDRVMVHGRF